MRCSNTCCVSPYHFILCICCFPSFPLAQSFSCWQSCVLCSVAVTTDYKAETFCIRESVSLQNSCPAAQWGAYSLGGKEWRCGLMLFQGTLASFSLAHLTTAGGKESCSPWLVVSACLNKSQHLIWLKDNLMVALVILKCAWGHVSAGIAQGWGWMPVAAYFETQ